MIKLKKLGDNQKIILILLAVFLSMLLLNYLTPLIADDYSYSIIKSKKENDFIKIIDRQINHYFTWGGRSVAHTIAQIFLIIIGKPIFNICNSAMYIALIWLIYRIARPNETKEKPILLLLIHLLLWFVVPVFGQDCIWLIGACNYLWTTVIILFFIYQYTKKKEKKDNILNMLLMFLFGILAGWTNENTAFGLIIVTAGIIYISKRKHKNINKWQISGLIGAILGFIILIAAPGNYVRMEEFEGNDSIVLELIERTLDYSITLVKYLLPIILIAGILIIFNVRYKKKIHKEVYLYFIAAFFTVYSMVLSPTFPRRAWFGVIVFAIIGIIKLLYNTFDIDTKLSKKKIYKVVLTSISIIFTLIFCNQYIGTVYSINELKQVWEYRVKYINQEKEKGNLNIILETYSTKNIHSPQYGLMDIKKGKDQYMNKRIADYYGVKSIESK